MSLIEGFSMSGEVRPITITARNGADPALAYGLAILANGRVALAKVSMEDESDRWDVVAITKTPEQMNQKIGEWCGVDPAEVMKW